MRRRLTPLLLLVGLVLAGCGGEDETPTTTSASTALPLTITRAGGVAGVHDRIVVRADGTGTVTAGGETRELAADDTTAVRSALRELVFDGLDERYTPPSGVEVSDGFDYAFTAGGRTITVEEEADGVPEPLEALRTAAAQVLAS